MYKKNIQIKYINQAAFRANLMRPGNKLPEIIQFPALNEQWKVDYIHSDTKKLSIIARPHQEIVLLGNINNNLACQKLLSLWIKQYAVKPLLTLLQDMSIKTQLDYRSASIRGQKTRWGSCSSKKNINLNYKLLFLPENLVNHIMIHELCHTVHLNHSNAFWNLVLRFDPHTFEHKKQVRNSNHLIPDWVL